LETRTELQDAENLPWIWSEEPKRLNPGDSLFVFGPRFLDHVRELVEKADKVVESQDPAPTPGVRPAAERGLRLQPPYRSDEGFFEHPDGSRSDESYQPEPEN